MIIPRLYSEVVASHYREKDPMLFLLGAQQVGKTTAALNGAKERELHSLHWDREEDRMASNRGVEAIVPSLEPKRAAKPLVLLDDLHRRRNWQRFLEEFYNEYHAQVDILVTGSGRPESLLGCLALYRVHPLSVAELLGPSPPKSVLREPQKLDEERWNALYRFGGFPVPLLRGEDGFIEDWARQRRQWLFEEGLPHARTDLLAEWLHRQVGSHTTLANLSKHVRVPGDAIRRGISFLESGYYVYPVWPWLRGTLARKYFLWDWSPLQDPGARAENFVGSHLLKACHFWTDYGFGDFDLYHLCDRQGREVDFCVVRDAEPWMLVEVKVSRNHGISQAMHHFAEVTRAPHAFQVVIDLPYEARDCFALTEPARVPARTLLSQLV